MEPALPLALPGLDRIIAATTAVEGTATAALALLEELIALRDRGDHIAGLMGRVADFDGMRAALTDAVAVAGPDFAALLAATIRLKHKDGWEDREEALAAQMPPPRLRIAAGG